MGGVTRVLHQHFAICFTAIYLYVVCSVLFPWKVFIWFKLSSKVYLTVIVWLEILSHRREWLSSSLHNQLLDDGVCGLQAVAALGMHWWCIFIGVIMRCFYVHVMWIYWLCCMLACGWQFTGLTGHYSLVQISEWHYGVYIWKVVQCFLIPKLKHHIRVKTCQAVTLQPVTQNVQSMCDWIWLTTV